MSIKREIISIMSSLLILILFSLLLYINLINSIIYFIILYIIINNFILYLNKVLNDYKTGSNEYIKCNNCGCDIRRSEGDITLKCYECGWKIGNKITRIFVHSIIIRNFLQTIKKPNNILSKILYIIILKSYTILKYIISFIFRYPFINIGIILLILMISTPVFVVHNHNNKEIVGNNETEINISETENMVFNMTNDRRTNHPFKNKLEYNKNLSREGIKHARDMAEHNYFSHTSLFGETVEERYSFCDSSENIHQTWIYKNVRDPGGIGNSATFIDTEEELADNIIAGWMNSEPHRENIYRDKWESMSINIAVSEDDKVYAVQSFCS